MNSIITRFAPSPTGNLHIGSVRTALVNYILTKQAKKKYPESKLLLRIEDTDKTRSTIEYRENIIKNLSWLGINYDDDPHIQSLNISRHKEVAFKLISENKAFKCICSKEILEIKREERKLNKDNNKRICDLCEKNLKIQSLIKDFVIRIKIPLKGEVKIKDKIQGNIIVKNNEIDDFIILRKDGTPTYMLSAVVDDFDMGVNLIIRGDDHLNNTFKQIFIYKNLNWPIPEYAHLPLIHGEDGKKLSKRHGAVDVQTFKEKGYLQESIINNLILLGWSPRKNEEIIEMEEIINLYKIDTLSKSSSIFSYEKLNFFNNFFIKKDKNDKKLINYCHNNLILQNYMDEDRGKLLRLFSIYSKKISFYKELEDICLNYFSGNFKTDKNILFTVQFNDLIKEFIEKINFIKLWEVENIENEVKKFITSKDIKFYIFGKPLRLLLINKENGPSVSDILFILGKINSIQRIKNYIKDI